MRLILRWYDARTDRFVMSKSKRYVRAVRKAARGALQSAVEHLGLLPRAVKRAIVLSHDAAACVVTMYIAFALRLGALIPLEAPLHVASAIAVVGWIFSGSVLGVYNNVFRFAGSGAIFALVRASALHLAILVGVLGFGSIDSIPRTVSVIQPVLLLLYLFVSRLVIRYVMIDLLQQFRFVGPVRKALIFGAGEAGQQVAQSIRHEPGIVHLGYIDDSPGLRRQRIEGKPIWPSAQLDRRIRELEITDILLALPETSRTRRQEIIQKLQRFDVHVMALPAVNHVIEGRVSYNDLREIDIEDLLGRAPVAPNADLLAAAITDRVVLITGAGGSIGSELCRQIVGLRPERIILAEMGEFALYSIEAELRERAGQGGPAIVAELLDVADRRSCDSLFARHRPQTVFHAAAYKHVPLIEANPLAGLRNNLFGTLNAAKAAQACEVERFILISTDKAVRPTNIMGASKRGCELILQGLAAENTGTLFAMVRFGNVLGSSGSVVPLFKRQIATGGPVTITHSQIVRYFMTIPEAALLVIQAGAMAKGGEVYVLDMGDAVKIRDLARTMIRLSGATVRDADNPDGDIEIVEIGLRPGEKLFEELLIGNNPQPTSHPRIMQAHEHALTWAEVQRLLDSIGSAIADGDAAAAKSAIQKLVPEYTETASNHPAIGLR